MRSFVVSIFCAMGEASLGFNMGLIGVSTVR